MASKFNLRITPRAKQDFNDILSYIDTDLINHKAAVDLYNKFLNAIDNARNFPLAAPVSAMGLPREVRKLIVEHYIVFYIVDIAKASITVLRVRYASCDLTHIF